MNRVPIHDTLWGAVMGVTREEGTFPGDGGLQLYYQSWRREQSLGTVGIVHGAGEHSGRYGNVVDQLTSCGFVIYGYDLRGHGHSPGRRIHISNWNEYRGDLAAFVRMMERCEPRSPLFLYAHSLGALIGAEYLLHHQDSLRGAVLSGIPLEPAGLAKGYLVAAARALSRVWPAFTLPLRLDPGMLSRDPVVVEAYASDPLVSGNASARWGTECLDAIRRTRDQAARIRIPVLFIHGEADRLNLPGGSRALYEAITSADKTLHTYPGTYHEAHNDLDFRTVVSDVAEWLTRRL